MKKSIPREVLETAETLRKAGFESYLVGGCVRDLLIGRKPKDWDIATNANPEEIQTLYKETFYENSFGTVSVVTESEDATLKVIEITPYRLEGKYSDKRRPDEITWASKLEDDLDRRDFTINAIAYDPSTESLIDPHKGQKDIKDKIVTAVGNPVDRFNEDALRILRAIRIATELGFDISRETSEAIQKTAQNLTEIAVERIQAEFSRVTISDNPVRGIELMRHLGVLKYIIPELEEGIGIEQRGEHIYDVWGHSLKSLEHAVKKNWPFHVRLAALVHDIAKPRTRQRDETRSIWTFHGHDVVGGRMVKDILRRLKYSNEIVDVVSKLVRYHLFFSDVDKITLSAVRRIVARVGPENVWDLMKLRACDRIGTGRPKEKPYRLRKYEAMIEEAMRAPISVSMLKINGNDLIEKVHVKPGPRMGWLLHALLEEVLDEPSRNTQEYLFSRVTELNNIPDLELQKLGEAGKDKKSELEEGEVAQIRKRHGVQ